MWYNTHYAMIHLYVNGEATFQEFWEDMLLRKGDDFGIPLRYLGILESLIRYEEAIVPRLLALAFLGWCAHTPGWDCGPTYAPTAIVIMEPEMLA